MKRFLLMLSFATLSAGCTTLPTQQCKSLRETGSVTLTIEDMDGSYHRTAYDHEIVQNPDPRVGLAEHKITLGEYTYRLIPFESCTDGLRIRFEDATKQTVKLLPWGQETIIEGSRMSGHFVAVTARQK